MTRNTLKHTLRDCVTRFNCYVAFVNNVICACREQLPHPSLLENLPIVTPLVRSSKGHESGKRIVLNSRHCPCEELTRRKHRYRQNSKVICSVTLT